MKAIASIHSPVFLDSPLPTTASWKEVSQRFRRQARAVNHPVLNTDELVAASKQEVVCSGILALCLLYTLGHCFLQIIS